MNKKTAISEKTKAALKNTFLELCTQKRFDDITVGEIARKAGVNRCTFYNHYEDISSLLGDIESELISDIQKRSETAFKNATIDDLDPAFEEMLKTFDEYGEKIYTLIGKNEDIAFRRQLMDAMKQNYRQLVPSGAAEEKLDYIAAFAVSAGLALFEHWYETGKKEPAPKFFRFSQALVANGVVGIITGNSA